MKRLILTLLAATLVSGALAQNSSFPDIPANHWAADAVNRIANLGIVIGFPDGTFRGNEAFTRYQAALVISRLLDVVNQNVNSAVAMTKSDIESLRNAVQGVASDVASQGVRLSSAESAIASLSDDVTANKSAIANNAAAISKLNDSLAGLSDFSSAMRNNQADIASNKQAIASNQAAIASNKSAIADNSSAVTGLTNDVTANKSAIASLSSRLDQLENTVSGLQGGAPAPAGGPSPAVLRDLQNQIASQRVAIDTAQAQADAAAKRANDAHDLAQQAMSKSQQNAADIANANTALQNLTDKLNSLSSQVNTLSSQVAGQQPTPAAPAPAPAPNISGLQGDVQRNTSDIANIREFVILLRRDQVALRDRVAALETSDTQQSKDIASLQKRVTALEQNPLGISGSIELKYFVSRGGPYAFDVDRAYGLNNSRSMGSSVFSTGAEELTDDSPGDSGYQTDEGEVAQDVQDLPWKNTQSGPQAGDLSSTLTINLSTSLNGAGSPNALNKFDAVLQLSLLKTGGLGIMNPGDSSPPSSTTGTPELDNGGSLTEGYVFHVDDFTTTFDGIGGAPLTFSFGTNVDTTFTPYVVNTDDPGFVATLTSPGFLSFINPSVTAVYVAPNEDQAGNTISNVYMRGAHLSLNPIKGVTVGGSFVQAAANAGDKNNVNSDNNTNTVYGVDANASVSIFNLGFEWDQGSNDNQTGANAATDSLLYAKLNVDGKSLPILNSLDVNYRDIPQSWENGNNVNYAMIYNNGSNRSNYPFGLRDDNKDDVGQKGYGATADLSLFILDVSGYFDTYDYNLDTTQASGPDTVQAFGADATAKLFAGFSLSGFFHHVTINGTSGTATAVGDLKHQYTADGTVLPTSTQADFGAGHQQIDHNYDTGFGVTLKLSGKAKNALIPGLNLAATYKQTGAEYGIRTIDVKGDFTLNVSVVTLTPYAEYENVSYGSNYTANNDGTTTIQAGAGLSTTPLSVPLQPSLIGAVNYRTTDHTGETGGFAYTSNEMQWSVGLMLNKFLFEHSTLTAKYGSWSGQNIEVNPNVNGTVCYDKKGNTSNCVDNATDISNGDVAPPSAGNDTQQSVSGYEVIWNYYDLEFSYGVYTNHRENVAGTGTTSDSSAQAFQIKYTVDF